MIKKFILLAAVVIIFISVVTLIAKIKHQSQATLTQASETNIPKDQLFTSVKNNLISQFPNFPVYPGALVSESRKFTGAVENNKGYSALWKLETADSVSLVADWYKSELIKDDYILDEILPDGPDEQIIKAKKDGNSYILIMEKEDQSGIEILLDIPLSEL